MKIFARKKNGCVYPPIGKYIDPPPAAKSFEQHEVHKVDLPGVQLRPDGVRQPAAEARILGTIVAIIQGRGPVDGDWLNRG